MFLRLCVFVCLIVALSSGGANSEDEKTNVLRTSRKKLAIRGRIRNPAISESSGLAKSRRWPNLFWTHNDSGNSARIFAIRGDGTNAKNGLRRDEGILVDNAENIDWEDIAVDDQGDLIIGDIGNNADRRSTLTLYRVREPNPFTDQKTLPAEAIAVYFPNRPDRAVNSEALFFTEGKIYLFTKTRGGVNTGLYRFDTSLQEETLPLMRVGSFDFKAPVTGADASSDGRHLAVLTYRGVWVFERPEATDNYLKGRRSSLFFHIWQPEAVCFDKDRLLISNEGGKLFEVEIGALLPLK
jgi:hypothetical protein